MLNHLIASGDFLFCFLAKEILLVNLMLISLSDGVVHFMSWHLFLTYSEITKDKGKY